MGGQQYFEQGAYARIDYVNGEIKELKRKHDIDMEGVKKSFEVAGQKQQELKEYVIKLETKIEVLQDLITKFADSGKIDSKIVVDENKTNVSNFVTADELTVLINKKRPDLHLQRGIVVWSLVNRGYLKPYFRDDGCINYTRPTGKGKSSGMVCGDKITKFNINNIDMFIELVIDYIKSIQKEL